jgi:iron complex transport system substrate-binding protein
LLRISRRLFIALPATALLPAAGLRAVAHGDTAIGEATPMPPTPALPVTVTDETGTSVTITDISRIIPLNGVTAEILWDLGLGANVAGVDVTATYPEAYHAYPNIGFGRQLAAEGILALNPTVVIGDTTAGPPEVIDQIRGAGVPVVIIKEFTDLQAPFEKIDAIAGALGVTDAGTELKKQVQAEVDAALDLAKTATSHPRVLFVYIRGSATQLIGGEGSGADTLIDAAGGIDAGTEAGVKGYVPVSAETLVTAAPDVILVMQSGVDSIGGMEGFLKIPGIAETPAGQNKNILTFDDQYLLGLGPRLGEMLTDLTYALHAELVPPAGTPEATPAGA